MPSLERVIKFREILDSLLQHSGPTVTRKKLASAIGVSEATVSHYVRGRIKPSFEALVGIAGYFNVTLDYLVFGEHQQAPVGEESSSVRVEVLRALAEANSYSGRQRDLVFRINQRLHDEVERVARTLLDSPENLGPAGFLTDPEAMAIESCAVRTVVMIRTAPADIAVDATGRVMVDENGHAVPGVYFDTLVRNINAGRRYQYLFYGKRPTFDTYARTYREMLVRADLAPETVHANVEFRTIDSELPIGIVIHELDVALLERREAMLWERYHDSAVMDDTLAYIATRHEDALGGIILYGTYFSSARKMFERDWRIATIL